MTLVNINYVDELKIEDCLKHIDGTSYKIAFINEREIGFRPCWTIPVGMIQTLLDSPDWHVWRNNENTKIL